MIGRVFLAMVVMMGLLSAAARLRAMDVAVPLDDCGPP